MGSLEVRLAKNDREIEAALFIHLHWLARLIGLSGLADRTSPGAIAGGLRTAPRIPVIHRKRCQAKTRYRGQDLPSPV